MINAGITQASLLGTTLFLVNLNDLPKIIFLYLVNIYADYTAVYVCTFKNLADLRLAANPSSDLTNPVQKWKNEHVTFSSCETKVISFHHD